MTPFIVFEGIDGTGKGTIMRKLMEKLHLQFGTDAVIQTKDPGGTRLGACIRQIMYGDVPTTQMAPGVVDLLFLASHLQNWLTTVKPALDAGKIVVCDRWWYSQATYMTQRTVPKLIADAYMGCHGDSPGLLVFLYGNPQKMVDRARSRETETHQTAKAWNDADVLDRIQQEYFAQFSTLPEWHAVCVDDKSIDEVWAEVEPAIDRYLAGICKT